MTVINRQGFILIYPPTDGAYTPLTLKHCIVLLLGQPESSKSTVSLAG